MRYHPGVVVSLDKLRPGTRATIAAIHGDCSALQRLLEMGLLEGTPIEYLRVALLGDPIEGRLGDALVTLRRREAACVEVTPCP